MAAFQKGQGGRKPGSKNKLTLAIAKARAEAMKTMNDALGNDAFKGDGVEFLQAVYKNPKFDFEIRMEAATRVAQFERAKKTESMIDDKREFVVRMPQPPKDLEEWRRLHMNADPQEEKAEAVLAERIARIAQSAKKDSIQ